MSDDAPPSVCCPDEDRIEGLVTVSGDDVADAHAHRGLLRGFIIMGDKNRLMHWYRNGRLSRRVEGEHDLRRTRG